MGGLLFGYDWVVIGGAKPFYEVYFNIADDPQMQGLAYLCRRPPLPAILFDSAKLRTL